MKWNKDLLGIIPAVVLWIISITTFVMGLSFDSGSSIAMWMGIGLALSTTVLQILGNGKTPKEQGPLMYAVWIASYVLGISSSAYALQMFLGIPNVFIDWTVSIAIGVIVEIVPEPAFVRFYKAFQSMRLFDSFRAGKKASTVRPNSRMQSPTNSQVRRTPITYYDSRRDDKWG